MTDLVLVLGDQLTRSINSLRDANPRTTEIIMAECASETGYVRHHRQKIALIFSAMRHFAEALRVEGFTVHYQSFDDPAARESFSEVIEHHLARANVTRLLVTEPGEWRLLREIRAWPDRFMIPVEIREDDRFLCSHSAFETWAGGRKTLRMEYFYREMRRRTGLLMDGDTPAGGRWNYDAENRKPAGSDLFMPRRFRAEADPITQEVLHLVEREFADGLGDLETFAWPVTRAQALAALEDFITHRLPLFGDYQDAMVSGEAFLYHSLISSALNIGLLEPLEVCHAAEQAWHAGHAPLNAVEGFIRQIIGWREYVRGIYWREGADYVHRNALAANRPLPAFYWTGETDMACLRAAIGQTLRYGYAHHIQRLMVTGTFAMLAGVDPHAVHEWYLGVYVDAFEWVEAPNTIGMSQFADGGLLASKPYAASGAYIDRMSNYCADCRYSVKDKLGPDACPFNALYWDFLARNEDTLRGNPRLGPVYRNWDRMDEARQSDLRHKARDILDNL